jgi:eukaryotic-like serine/threonine-protein kinase
VAGRASILASGVVIDGFRLDEKIHHGSMATIWSVTGGPETGFPLAMKIPLLRNTDAPAAMVGFEVEQMILPTLIGRHVPRFVAAGDFSAQPYIVMERIPGVSLRARVSEAPLDASEVAAIGARVAAAVHDLHGQHVIHLDVKPSNVLFRETGEAVLIDFGLSRHDRMPDLLAEQFRLPMGTGPYISPEQIRHVRSEPRSDVFALGVLLYLLLTGERPFGNPTTLRGLHRRLYRIPTPPRALTRDCPPWLQEVILRCLEVDPGDRFETAAQLGFQLQHPEQVALTGRAARTTREGAVATARRWARLLAHPPDSSPSAAEQLARAPFVVVAIDLAGGTEALSEALRLAVRRLLQTQSGARLACVTVVKTLRIAIETNVEGEGQSLRMARLVELKHWARPLGVPPHRITYHVLEAPDPGSAIVEFSRANHVDQIVIGSRGSSTLRRYLGSVSSQVVAQAQCTVTVVKTGRLPQDPATGLAPGSNLKLET